MFDKLLWFHLLLKTTHEMALQIHRVYGSELLAENAQVATKVFLPPISAHLFDSTFVQGGKADFQLEQFQSSVSKFALKTIFSVPDWIFSNNCLQVLTKMRRIHTGIAPSQQQ